MSHLNMGEKNIADKFKRKAPKRQFRAFTICYVYRKVEEYVRDFDNFDNAHCFSQQVDRDHVFIKLEIYDDSGRLRFSTIGRRTY